MCSASFLRMLFMQTKVWVHTNNAVKRTYLDTLPTHRKKYHMLVRLVIEKSDIYVSLQLRSQASFRVLNNLVSPEWWRVKVCFTYLVDWTSQTYREEYVIKVGNSKKAPWGQQSKQRLATLFLGVATFLAPQRAVPSNMSTSWWLNSNSL